MPSKPTKQKLGKPKKGGQKGGVQLIPQPHGGALLPGGQKGQTPGPGRPPNALRESMRGDLDKLLPDLWAKYKAQEIDALDFANFLAKFGLGTQAETTITNHPEFQAAARRHGEITESVIRSIAPAQMANDIITQIAQRLTEGPG